MMVAPISTFVTVVDKWYGWIHDSQRP